MKWKVNYKVNNLDTDMNQVLSLTGIMRYMQDTAFYHMEAKKPSYEELFRDGKAFMINRLTLEVYRTIPSHSDIVLETWASNPPDFKGLTYDHCFRILLDGEVAAEAITVWSLFDFENKKFIRANEAENNYCTEEILPLDIPKRLHLPKDVDFSLVDEHTVSYRDVDMNRHMNNTVYGNLFCGYIPEMEGKHVVHFDMNYRGEAPLGESIKVYMHSCGNGEYLFKSTCRDKPNTEAIIKVAEI